jgi:hypothetical protein
MREGQSGLVHDVLSVEEQVEVDRARAEALVTDPAQALLDAEEAVEQTSGRELRFDSHRAVEERALLDGPDRLGLPDLRDPANLNAVLGGKELDRP